MRRHTLSVLHRTLIFCPILCHQDMRVPKPYNCAFTTSFPIIKSKSAEMYPVCLSAVYHDAQYPRIPCMLLCLVQTCVKKHWHALTFILNNIYSIRKLPFGHTKRPHQNALILSSRPRQTRQTHHPMLPAVAIRPPPTVHLSLPHLSLRVRLGQHRLHSQRVYKSPWRVE